PEFPGIEAAGLQDEIDRLRQLDIVDYSGVAAAKLRGLTLAYEHFRTAGSPARRSAFEAFRAERGAALERFAAFEVLRRKFPQVWWEWPDPWRCPTDADLASLRREQAEAMGFYEFTQWTADTQL